MTEGEKEEDRIRKDRREARPESRVAPTLGALMEFLEQIGADKIIHTSRPYAAHLAGTYIHLRAWGFSEDAAAAGFFHSIYGTERFRESPLPLDRRGDLRTLIGDYSELLAYTNCALVHDDFRQAEERGRPYTLADRFTREPAVLGDQAFRDLCGVRLADWLEQVPIIGRWDYRREVYERLATRLGEGPAASFLRLYAVHLAK